MDQSIEYNPLVWRFCADEGYFYLVRRQHGRMARIYGPFDQEEARHAGEIWGVEFPEQVVTE